MEIDLFWSKQPATERAKKFMVALYGIFAGLAVAVTTVDYRSGFLALAAISAIILGAVLCLLFDWAASRSIVGEARMTRRMQLASKQLADDIVADLGDSPVLARDVYEKLGHALAKGFPEKKIP